MKSIIVFLAITASTTQAQASDSLSLEDAIRIGLQQSKSLLASSMRVEAAEARAGEANTSLLPSFKFESSYRRLSDVDPFEVSVPFLPTPVTISPIVLNNYSLKVAMQQPIFTGFKLSSNVRAAEYMAQATEFEHKSDRADLVLGITNAYWILYQTIEVKKYVDENVVRLEAQLKDVDRLMNAGLATRNDLLKVQLQLGNARLTQLDAENDVRVAGLALNNLIGRPLDSVVRLSSKPEDKLNGARSALAESPQKDLYARALNERPELLAMSMKIRAADESVTAAQGNWWPQLFLSGNYYYSRPNPRYLPTRDEFKGTWDVGVVLQLDLWNWGATSFQTQQAKAQLQQNEYLFDQLKDNVSLEITRAQLAVKRGRDKIEVARVAIEQAEENYRSTDDKFKVGLATTTDLLDADVALLQARANLTGATVEYALSQARLARAVGEKE